MRRGTADVKVPAGLTGFTMLPVCSVSVGMVGGLSPAAVVDALLGASGRPEQTHVHEAQRADEGSWKQCQPQLLLISQLINRRRGFSALFSPSRQPLHKKATSHKFLLIGLAASFLLPEGCGSLLQVFVLNCSRAEIQNNQPRVRRGG